MHRDDGRRPRLAGGDLNTARLLRLGVAVAAVAGCGAERVDPAVAATTPIGRAITAELLEGGGAVLTDADATCISGEIVAGIGEDELRSLGATPESVRALGDAELSGDQIAVIVDAWATCVDVEDILTGSPDVDLDDDAAACLSGRIDLDLAKALLAASLSGTFDLGDRAVQELAVAAAACGVSLG